MLADLFDWHIRWEGPAIYNGYAIHVGTEEDYLAIYAKSADASAQADGETDPDASYDQVNGLNHIGVVVEDLDATEQRVIAAGYQPNNHADYEPGRRFYFDDHDGIEFEVASYIS